LGTPTFFLEAFVIFSLPSENYRKKPQNISRLFLSCTLLNVTTTAFLCLKIRHDHFLTNGFQFIAISSRYSVVGITLSAGWAVQTSDPVRKNEFSFFKNSPDVSGSHSAYCVISTGLFFTSGLFDRSTPSRAEVMNKWSYTSIPAICLHDMNRDNFYLFTFIIH
jgi:hypothetical protein